MFGRRDGLLCQSRRLSFYCEADAGIDGLSRRCRLAVGEALLQEIGEARRIPDDLHVLLLPLGDLQGRTKDIPVPAEEMGGSLHATSLTFVPAGKNGVVVNTAGYFQAEFVTHAAEYGGVRDVPTLLEKSVTEGEACPLAKSEIGTIRALGQSQGRKRGAREVVRVEVAEQHRRHLLT